MPARRRKRPTASARGTCLRGDIGFKKKDMPKLVKLTFETPGLTGLLGCASTGYNEKSVEKVCADLF